MRANDRYGDKLLKSHTQAESVLVNLDALYPPPAGATGGEGLKLTGWASGALHGWLKSSAIWIGVVTVLVETHEGRTYRAEGPRTPAPIG